jgi:hypothetical protein
VAFCWVDHLPSAGPLHGGAVLPQYIAAPSMPLLLTMLRRCVLRCATARPAKRDCLAAFRGVGRFPGMTSEMPLNVGVVV